MFTISISHEKKIISENNIFVVIFAFVRYVVTLTVVYKLFTVLGDMQRIAFRLMLSSCVCVCVCVCVCRVCGPQEKGLR